MHFIFCIVQSHAFTECKCQFNTKMRADESKTDPYVYQNCLHVSEQYIKEIHLN